MYLKRYFNPLPPWGGRLLTKQQAKTSCLISIHSLRGEGDVRHAETPLTEKISIHSLRGEGDNVLKKMKAEVNISIHSLRGEGDGF